MPELSRFYGIVIKMYFGDHDPPHFHAWYSGAEGTVNILNGEVAGDLPRRVVALLLEWWHLHREELVENWQLARTGQTLHSIKPLE